MSTVLLREVPVDSVVHRLWAGTKMIAAFTISLLLMFWPMWPVLGVIIVFLIAIAVVARIPLGALPRLPLWFWGLVVLGGLVNIPNGTRGVLVYAQVVVFGLVLLGASLLIAFTTPMGEVAPALAKLGAPLRKLKLPVDEWAVVVALTLRGLPLLLDEIRVLRAARKLRPKESLLHRASDANPLIDILTACMAVSSRRAGELAEAITARGGTGMLTAHPSGPTRRDAVALAIVFAVCAGALGLNAAL
ncbi:energy-coupling factor transporter transmembrane component T family protein [Nocardia caishijiensis]|uniref:Energy-coupling factor transport system permease protein n=1 Tax=Nocardia caishijiensis TaxID=184756 RepID=A0ABQ6YQS7_9NOCA|nr:energy-coupling factor transporter transmembrane protein EcfT [Nocardia caishijiensis]KAF0848110.1 energy-coupling factor transport system permease protein [Nocardia caishijiensis]